LNKKHYMIISKNPWDGTRSVSMYRNLQQAQAEFERHKPFSEGEMMLVEAIILSRFSGGEAKEPDSP